MVFLFNVSSKAISLKPLALTKPDNTVALFLPFIATPFSSTLKLIQKMIFNKKMSFKKFFNKKNEFFTSQILI